VSVHILLWVAVNALFADAIVQRPSLDEVTLASAVWASTIVGVAAAVIQLGSGPILRVLLADPRLPGMAALLALPLPLVGAGGAMQGKLTRERNYRALAGRTLIGQGLGTFTGIAVAVAGGGAWALVLQQMVTAAAGALALLVRAGWRPQRGILGRQDLRAVRELMALGLPLTASTLVQLGRYRLFALLIGATAGAAPLGEVHMAFRLVDTVRELAFTALWRLMLPAMSARQHDLVALRGAVDRCLALASIVMFPLLAAMAVVVVPLVTLLLGPAWVAAGSASLPLIVLTAWLLLWFPPGVALIARARPGPALAANVAAVLAMVVGVAVLRPANPGQAMVVWVVAQLVTSLYTIVMTARVLRTGLLRPIRAGLPALGVAAAAAVAALLGPWLLGEPQGHVWLIVVRLACGAPVCVVGSAWCLARLGVLDRLVLVLRRGRARGW
jgi:O-antigen/teichoic acid export membrane protein